jgi:hypothetical protein
LDGKVAIVKGGEFSGDVAAQRQHGVSGATRTRRGVGIRRKERERLGDKMRLDAGQEQAVDLDGQVAEEVVIKKSANAGKFWTQLGLSYGLRKICHMVLSHNPEHTGQI